MGLSLKVDSDAKDADDFAEECKSAFPVTLRDLI